MNPAWQFILFFGPLFLITIIGAVILGVINHRETDYGTGKPKAAKKTKKSK